MLGRCLQGGCMRPVSDNPAQADLQTLQKANFAYT